MSSYVTTIPGYPRVGPKRAYKTLLEDFWNGKLTSAEFTAKMDEHRAERLKTQADGGLDYVPSGDFSLYDHVLDTALMLGCLPDRFKGLSGIDAYFAAARGKDGIPPMEMTKWFDTNYHYLVPELPAKFALAQNKALADYEFAKKVVGDKARPVLLGPFTFLKLARLEGAELGARLTELLPIYKEIIESLVAAGAQQISVDESALAGDLTSEEVDLFVNAYKTLNLPVIVQVAYGDVLPYWSAIKDIPVQGFALDFASRGRAGNLKALQQSGFPADKILHAGVIDGRNIWRSDLDEVLSFVKSLASVVAPERTVISGSCSLLHLPETLDVETDLDANVKAGLCFAQERLVEIRSLAKALRGGDIAGDQDWAAGQSALAKWKGYTARFIPAVSKQLETLTEAEETRLPYEERRKLQQDKLQLPQLPTTTIGSFPQTPELRKARAARKKDELAYNTAIRAEIEKVIRLQEEIGLDVLVHGEPERNDMVQFFGDQLKGFATTSEGWVQSYGSRCVRPPIIYGDIERLQPMTVTESAYAQSLTDKPVKGMLTGPITILQWSFVREDISRAEVANQIALVIRAEVADLEKEGIGIVQVDEAAYREGLPLRRSDWPAYISWAVRAFRIATAGAKPETQIHTHMCYSEFGDIIEAIDQLNADVISIEDTRSDGALIGTLKSYQYPRQIGPGVYDIHSPNVPAAETMAAKLQQTLSVLPREQVWVNPDCGLKTRKYEEVVPSLKNMVKAAEIARSK